LQARFEGREVKLGMIGEIFRGQPLDVRGFQARQP
jgi:hypothetical protein